VAALLAGRGDLSATAALLRVMATYNKRRSLSGGRVGCLRRVAKQVLFPEDPGTNHPSAHSRPLAAIDMVDSRYADGLGGFASSVACGRRLVASACQVGQSFFSALISRLFQGILAKAVMVFDIALSALSLGSGPDWRMPS